MIYCRYFCRLTLIILCIGLLACGEDVPTKPGEEVVTDKWVDPVDIGKDYTIKQGDIELHVPYLLDTGETITFTGELDSVILTENEDGSPGVIKRVPLLDENGNPVLQNGHPRITEEHIGNIVPEGPPILSLRTHSEDYITKENNVKDQINFTYYVGIDRQLDYNLPIYLEYRVQDIEALGSEVHVIRYIGVVEKGSWVALLSGDETVGLDLGDRDKHQKASISILPYTEMQKIDLPATTGHPDRHTLSPIEISAIPKGHTFRPYRIRSSSFLMAKPEIEGTW